MLIKDATVIVICHHPHPNPISSIREGASMVKNKTIPLGD